ncbi:hypothetical protein [Chamaesiphon sp. VAR_48_metabat_403]|uniref:hypothetical protein n=1 Tax=Chamaesiphon sp. VAR_48_metabat_403 TaxID=2964700 RepID=UPI00286E5926|nr:hypothetical protein [Chamaesiphon sp. VAR_48_metabat_403]
MKIGIKFNRLTYREYIYILDRHQKYTDFNPLALYRSIIENDKLDLDQKIAIRDLANQHFSKFFEFLQIKDRYTYMKVSTLGETLTAGEEDRFWKSIHENQEKILKAKRIKHRNFGINSKGGTITYDLKEVYVMVRPGYNYPGKRSRAWEYPYHLAAKKRAARANKADIENQLIDLADL